MQWLFSNCTDCILLTNLLQVQIFLADKNINDLQTLNETLTNFLSLDALKSDMESFRDEIIEYYLQDGGVGGADGEAEDHQAQAEMEQKGGSGQ